MDLIDHLNNMIKNECFCKQPCWRYIDGHCDGTEYEFNYYCEQLLEENKNQRKCYFIGLNNLDKK